MNDQALAPEPITPAPGYDPPVSAPAPELATAPVRAGFQGQRQPFDPRDKSPRIAAAISVIPGLGQIYIGYYVRGFVTAATFLVMVYMANAVPGDVAPMFGFSAAFVWLFNIIDAGRTAALYNHSIAGAESIELPENFKMPATGGSLVGGALLTAFGLLALSNTALGFSLLWLENWWPIFPLALGLYLVAISMKERAS
jgi:TM2 domain-containing membrane protein YozV